MDFLLNFFLTKLGQHKGWLLGNKWLSKFLFWGLGAKKLQIGPEIKVFKFYSELKHDLLVWFYIKLIISFRFGFGFSRPKPY